MIITTVTHHLQVTIRNDVFLRSINIGKLNTNFLSIVSRPGAILIQIGIAQYARIIPEIDIFSRNKVRSRLVVVGIGFKIHGTRRLSRAFVRCCKRGKLVIRARRIIPRISLGILQSRNISVFNLLNLVLVLSFRHGISVELIQLFKITRAILFVFKHTACSNHRRVDIVSQSQSLLLLRSGSLYNGLLFSRLLDILQVCFRHFLRRGNMTAENVGFSGSICSLSAQGNRTAKEHGRTLFIHLILLFLGNL